MELCGAAAAVGAGYGGGLPVEFGITHFAGGGYFQGNPAGYAGAHGAEYGGLGGTGHLHIDISRVAGVFDQGGPAGTGGEVETLRGGIIGGFHQNLSRICRYFSGSLVADAAEGRGSVAVLRRHVGQRRVWIFHLVTCSSLVFSENSGGGSRCGTRETHQNESDK